MVILDRERMGGRLIRGSGCVIDDTASIDISADVTLCDGCSISEEVLILTHDHTPGDIASKHASPLIIGPGVWIGARAIILASVDTIGEGAVIGAGSVLTKSVGAHELWAGNPARLIRRI